MNDVGRLVPGKRAGIAVLDLRNPPLGSTASERGADLAARIVWTAHRNATDALVLDGREVACGDLADAHARGTSR